MSKLIAICGSPSSGKTTAGIKIAQEVYFTKNVPVLYLSPDVNTPALSLIFPRYKKESLQSFGKLMDKISITSEDVLKQTVHSDKMKDFGFLGLKLSENRYSYPTPTEDKVHELFRACAKIAPYVFVDCQSHFDDMFSVMAKLRADSIIQFITADLKCMGYYSSYEGQYEAIENKAKKVLNINDRDVFLPIDEVKKHFKNVEYELPFSLSLKQQTIAGTLPDRITDMKFRRACAKIAKAVL